MSAADKAIAANTYWPYKHDRRRNKGDLSVYHGGPTNDTCRRPIPVIDTRRGRVFHHTSISPFALQNLAKSLKIVPIINRISAETLVLSLQIFLLSKFSAVVVCHNVKVPSGQKLTTIPVKKNTGTFDIRFVHNMHILYY